MVSDEIEDVLAKDAADEDFDVLAEEFDGDDVEPDTADDVEDDDAFAEDDEDPADEAEQPAGDLAGVDAIGDDEDDEPSAEPAVDLAVLEDLVEDDELPTDDEEDGLQAGEFVCRSCHMAKRASALADQDAMLCRDCV